MDNLTAARWQMELSLGFHMIFAATGMAMPLMMLVAEGRWLRTGDPDALRLARTWAKVTAVLFAIGAVSVPLGLEVFRRIRAQAQTAVIMLTAKGEETDRVVGLELGADDYITKPFSPREVVARVRTVLRRARQDMPVALAVLRYGDLEIDRPRREVRLAGHPVKLTRKEFDLLALLASRAGVTFTRSELLDEVWDFAWDGDTSTVTVHIRRLREKIEVDPSEPRRLITVWGIGYRFDP